MPLTERNANFRTSHTAYCTRTKPFRNGPTYIKSSQTKTLPPVPAATLSRAPSPAQASRTLLDATERELSPSQFPTLSATPSRAVSASPSSPSGRGSDDKRSRLPRPSFFPEGRDSLTLGRPAPSPGRAYSPPAASYSTVRPVRNSDVSSASLASTPRKCVASSLQVRRTNGAKVVAIPAAAKPLQAAEQPVPSLDGEVAVGMDEQAAPAPVVHRSAEQREERERGRKGFFASGKSAETRSKSKTRKVLEKMSGLVRKRASQVELAAGSRPTISGPLEGSFVHVDSSESRDEGSEAVPPVPALPAARPLIPDRAPPPPPMPASQPAISAPPGPSQANDLDPGLLENNEQERNVEETDLITASQHLRDMADRALTTEARASFLGFATAFTNARIFLAQANLAAERAQRSAQEALLHQGEARLSVMRLAEVARNLTAVAEGDGENSTTSQQPPAPPRPQMAGQRQGRTMGLRRKTLAEMEREARK
ncbi:hypothetical protein PRZ48_004361 [Zasmidium cellare]|uniref:Uncharacterized protein n=1 Tax=Zasmidium cellare TaxID=395010 RepID=A0ABR0EPB0_ZASCE|nr:hypothetical protein PRZ48_004361 [Zasmidium cellare]